MNKTSKHLAHVLAIAGLVALPACSEGPDTGGDAGTTAAGSGTLASSLGTVPELSTVNRAIDEAELNSVFDGVGSYTLLAPTDAAFEALGTEGERLLGEDQRPVLVGILREHILPGYLQPEDIGKALDAQGGSVTMTTFGGGEVTFKRDGEAIVVTRSDGSSATLESNAVAAANGVIIPISAVLTPQ